MNRGYEYLVWLEYQARIAYIDQFGWFLLSKPIDNFNGPYTAHHQDLFIFLHRLGVKF